MSHGETFKVAKLFCESTTLPLLTVGCWMSAGFWGFVLDNLGLMRDVVEGRGAGAPSVTEPSKPRSGSEDSRRLFRDVLSSMTLYRRDLLLKETCEVSLSEFEAECEEFRRMSRAMAAGGEVK